MLVLLQQQIQRYVKHINFYWR